MEPGSQPGTFKIPQHNTPRGTWCRFSGCDSYSGTCPMCAPTAPEPYCNHDAPAVREGVCECGALVATGTRRPQPIPLDGCTCGGIGDTGSHRAGCPWAAR